MTGPISAHVLEESEKRRWGGTVTTDDSSSSDNSESLIGARLSEMLEKCSCRGGGLMIEGDEPYSLHANLLISW